MAIRAPSPSRFIKLPGPARTPPRTPADEYKMFDEFVRAPYVMYKPPGTPASRFELAHHRRRIFVERFVQSILLHAALRARQLELRNGGMRRLAERRGIPPGHLLQR